jgi:hypothetical protein
MAIDSNQENIIGFNNKFISLNYNLISSKKTVQMSEYQKVDKFKDISEIPGLYTYILLSRFRIHIYCFQPLVSKTE